MGFFDFLLPFKFGAAKSVSIDTERKIKGEWDKIGVLTKGTNPSQLRQALISADKTLDNALRDMVPGESMGERLKNAKEKFDKYTYRKIWEAHKMRNNLVHESGFEPPHYIVKEAISDLKDSLYKLGLKL